MYCGEYLAYTVSTDGTFPLKSCVCHLMHFPDARNGLRSARM